jgi:hypothetical protein
MSCPVCKRKACVWIELKKHPEKLSTEKLKQVVNHNLDYIDMLGRQNSISADAEERMYHNLSPYTDELEKRK